MLPVSNAEKKMTPFLDCLFTATSASCVTGLIVRDTGTYWSFFGKLIILIMIQIGGLGVVTMSAALFKMTGKKMSLHQRMITQESLSAEYGGGIMKFVYFMIKTTLLSELCGAILLLIPFCREFGVWKGICFAFFHSISAYCNAGFDLMGNFTSLTRYVGNIYVNIVIMLLIICGGLGFGTWSDVRKYKQHFSRYSLQSKVILITSAILIFVPAIYFYFLEYSQFPFKERILSSLFQSVTNRTAGFNTTDQASLSDSGKLVSLILMMIGGSPGSTAGGMKTTTIALLVISASAIFIQSEDTQIHGRRISDQTIKTASAIFLLYVMLFLFSAILICGIEKLPLIDCLYEIASAIGTVGLTTGITPSLHSLTRCVLIFLMFFGRVGALTLIYVVLPRSKETSRLPIDHINVG